MKWFGKKNNNNSKFNFDRLLQVNSKDPAIFTNYSVNNFIDLSMLINHDELHKFLFSNNSEIQIENNDILENLIDEVKYIDDFDELLEFCHANDILLTDSDLQKLSKNFKDNKLNVLKTKITKNISSLTKKINCLIATNKKNTIEENIYTLYLCAYFLKAKVNDTYINAPLLLYRVEIVFRSSDIYIRKIDSSPILNEKLNFMLQKQLGIKFNFNNDITYKNILEYKKYLSAYLNNKQQFFTNEFVKFNNSECQDFEINNYVCLNLIEPTGGIIKKNIEEILDKKINPFDVNTKIINADKYEDNVINDDDIIEINQKLNIYQKYAIKSALEQNTLIYGPPGTGKSEVIASIIANIIYRYDSKPLSILVSSEKKVALDVINERINNLSNLSLTISDIDEKDFYEKLKKYESLIRRTLNKIKFDSPSKEYQNILTSYKDLNLLINEKLSNKSSLDSFFESMSDMNMYEFEKYHNNNYLNQINKILAKQKFNLEQFIVFANRFKEETKPYKNELDVLIMHKNFDSFDSSFLKEFLEKYNQSTKQDFIISSLITKNKIITKKPLFGATQKLVLDVNQENMINLIKVLVDLNINKLSRDEIILIKSFNLNFNDLNQYLIYNDFIENIQKNKYLKSKSINQLLSEYVDKRNQLNKINDSLIFENFIYKKCTEINKLNANEKQRIFELFGLSYLKNKPNFNFVVTKYFNELKFLFPIWFASPEKVCSLIENKKDIFNYGIFDEASQMFVEKAFPLVYRSKIKIVAGDDKQLQPSSFFMKKLDNDNPDQINTESLFEIANVCLWNKFYLRNHYRSKSAELIKFSNEYFYDNKLEFSSYNGLKLKPMVVHNVDGIWENNHNDKEIQTVINVLDKNKYLLDKKILVISFNSIQSKMMIDEFNKKFNKSKQWLNKLNNGTLSFCALEEVQGNEADVVILSISYAKSSDNKFRQFFGPLSQKNGQNRLNVAITRAKEQMIIVKSISGGDIKLSDNESNNIFKYYLTYCDQFASSSKTLKNNNELNLINNETQKFISDNILDNIIQFLTSTNKFKSPDITFIKNKIIGNKLLDIVVYDKQYDHVLFALKINNNSNQQLKSNIQFLDEIQFLSDLGYKIYTFNIIDWFVKNNVIQEEILYILK